jgi:hypothetical protein
MNFTPQLGPTIRLSASTDSAPFVSRTISLSTTSIVLGQESLSNVNGETPRNSSPSNGLFSVASLNTKHAEIWVQGRQVRRLTRSLISNLNVHVEGQVYIRDLKSKHGTYVNGVELAHPSILQSGDIIVRLDIGVSISTPPYKLFCTDSWR